MEYARRHNAAASACISGRNAEGYRLYAQVVALILKDRASNSTKKIPGMPAHINARALYLDALHAIAAGISHELFDPVATAGVLTTLDAVAHATLGTRAEFDAAILANYALARHAWTTGDREKAANFNVAAIKAGENAQAAGVRLGHYAAEKLDGARNNLLQLRLPEGSAAKAAHGAAMAATAPGGVAYRAALPGGQPAVAASLCAACGKDLAASLCSRCKAVRYCGPECQRAHWRAHKAACKAVSAGAPGSGPAAAAGT